MTEHYELLYIVPVKVEDDKLIPTMEIVAGLIKENGGEITKDDNLGKLKLAYPIKHIHQGHYVLIEFDIKKSKLKDLDRALVLTSEVLRHMIVIKKIKTEAELAEEKRKQERLRKEKTKELENKKEEEKAPATKPTEEDKKKVSIEDLDKKLDEILDDSII